MKKLLFTTLLTLISCSVFSQWTTKTIKNGFDEPFRKAYTVTNNYGWLSMESGYEQTEVINPNDSTKSMLTLPLLYLNGSYFCDDNPDVDIVFVVAGVDKKWTVSTDKSSDSEILFFPSDLFSNPKFKSDFLSASKVRVRVNESHCSSDYYTFGMSGSTASYNFIVK